MATRGKLTFLQGFRALAAGSVALSHIFKELTGVHGNGLNLGGYEMSFTFGVDLFFVISGFIMVYTTRDAKGGAMDARAFIERRLFRVVPVYWLYTSLFLASILLASSSILHSQTDLWHIISSYLFIPYPWPHSDVIEPVFVLGWTLNYEMFFYVVFALSLLLPQKSRLSALVPLFVGLWLLGFAVDRGIAPLWYWTRSSILEFLFGALVAHFYLKGTELSGRTAIAMLAASIVLWQAAFFLFPVGLNLRGIVWGIPAAMMVASVAFWPQGRTGFSEWKYAKPFVIVGDASYSLYLVHMFVVRAVSLLLPKALLGVVYPFVFVPVAFAGAIFVSHLSYIWFERPVHNFASSRFSAAKPVAKHKTAA